MIFEIVSLSRSSFHFAPLLSHFFPSGTTKTKRARSIATFTRTLKSWENLGFAYDCFHFYSHPQW